MTAQALPHPLAMQVEGYLWAPCSAGQSEAVVHRLHGKPGAPDLFLKYAAGSAADQLMSEMVKLHWLSAHLPVPNLVSFVRDANAAWMLTSAIDGLSAADLIETNPAAGPELVDALVAFMVRLHAIPASTCPFNSQYPLRLAQAGQRIADGLVDSDDFDVEREGWTAEQVWEAIQKRLPLDADLVVTHGDFSLDNLLVKDGAVVGCIDVGRLGLADRYQDLAILWNCLREYGPALPQRVFDRYGLSRPDFGKVEFHLLLDELF